MKIQTVQPVIKETSDCDKCSRHYQFEIFVRQKMLTAANFDLLLKKNHGPGGDNDYDEPFREPHFKLKSRFSENVFYADARYINRISKPSVEWCQPLEFKRYQELDETMHVYILIGEGARPASPERVFFFPVKNMGSNRILYSRIEKYSISPLSDLNEAALLLARLNY